MNLFFDSILADGYKSNSQKIRILTEYWIEKEAYCPYCKGALVHFKNNMPVADFYCDKCKEQYELKSSKTNMHYKVVDGSYSVMLQRLQNAENPNFFFLRYSANNVIDFIAVPKFIFVPEIIEKRTPLSKNAKRNGWVGCNILTKNIPKKCKVFYVKNSEILQKDKVVEDWKRVLFLKKEKDFLKKGWLLDVMKCIDALGKKEFSLYDMYLFEKVLAKKHCKNKHVKDKIRQQLQILRDNKYLTFVSKGQYRII
jgi:type II restriction enzyme